mgnify:CR=1 FL=1
MLSLLSSSQSQQRSHYSSSGVYGALCGLRVSGWSQTKAEVHQVNNGEVLKFLCFCAISLPMRPWSRTITQANITRPRDVYVSTLWGGVEGEKCEGSFHPKQIQQEPEDATVSRKYLAFCFLIEFNFHSSWRSQYLQVQDVLFHASGMHRFIFSVWCCFYLLIPQSLQYVLF